jgi:restriction system protein
MAIWTTRGQLVSSTGEIVGHKSGLALTREQVGSMLADSYASVWNGPDEAMLRIRPEEYEEIVAIVLHGAGNIPDPYAVPFGIRLHRKYMPTPELFQIFCDVLALFPDFVKEGMALAEQKGTKTLDPTPFVEQAQSRHGLDGARMALELLEDAIACQHRSPWDTFRRIEWNQVADLEDLFRSESLETKYGTFFDQRFIDYLAENFDDIGSINWRKFEGLTCEFFERLGFRVDIGPGRNDEGIDARMWPKGQEKDMPPAMIVQCKRQKKKVDKVVVKALWADVVSEGAQSGLVVTTSALSPGARRVCSARGYEIAEANRGTLKKWLEALRTPQTGIITGY